MSIEYKISWVDDSRDWVESIEDSIKSHLKVRGYVPKIDFYGSAENVDTSKLTEVDLIIIDYQLPGSNGDELIKQIRNKECLTKIVFYSQGAFKPSEHLDGIYYETRDAAEELIKNVIDQTIKKAQDITLVRGFIIAEAIDVENILEECMVKVFEDKGELFSQKVIGAKPPVYIAIEKFKFVKRMVKDRKKDEQEGTDRYEQLEDIDKIMNELPKEVFDQRNILAHSKKTINKDGLTILEGINKQTRKINFDQEWLSQTRKNIAKHKDNLMQLKNIL